MSCFWHFRPWKVCFYLVNGSLSETRIPSPPLSRSHTHLETNAYGKRREGPRTKREELKWQCERKRMKEEGRLPYCTLLHAKSFLQYLARQTRKGLLHTIDQNTVQLHAIWAQHFLCSQWYFGQLVSVRGVRGIANRRVKACTVLYAKANIEFPIAFWNYAYSIHTESWDFEVQYVHARMGILK